MKTPFRFLLTLSLFIFACTGTKMNTPEVIRLGEIQSGEIIRNADKSETNDPAPIVLWSGSAPGAVLYFSSIMENGPDKTHIHQKIDKLYGDRMRGLLHSMSGDYPISADCSFIEEKDQRFHNIIAPSQMLTADINGDGTDELILVKSLGSVYVYGSTKKLYQRDVLPAKPGNYEYRLNSSHIARINSKDVVFLVIERWPSPFSETDDSAKPHSRDSICSVLRIDDQGISEISLHGAGWIQSQVLSVGAMNFPGSSVLDEIVVCSKAEEEKQIYISRHRLDGLLIDARRKAYVEMDSEALSFVFVPQSSSILLRNLYQPPVYFVSPGNKVNWLRRVDVPFLLKADSDFHFMGFTKFGNELVALVRHDTNIFGLDRESCFYSWKEGRISMAKEKIPLCAFHLESPAHKVVDVVVADKNNSTFLVIQSRKPQSAAVPKDALIAAGEKFLMPDDLSLCDRYKAPRFRDYERDQANQLAMEKKINRNISSLEDIRKYLPQFYDTLVKRAESDFLGCLQIRLLNPVNQEGASLSDAVAKGRYLRKSEYLQWLESTYTSGEVIFCLWTLVGNEIGKWSISDSYYPEDPALQSEIAKGPVEYRGSSAHGTAVMTLQRKDLKSGDAPAYYIVKW
jgi:hypothetical protein